MTNTASREGGIGFGSLRDRLRDLEYPAGTADVVADCGDATLEFADGEMRVGDALAVCGDHTFESATGVEATLFSMVPIDAIGRKRYTDRGCLAAQTGPARSL